MDEPTDLIPAGPSIRTYNILLIDDDPGAHVMLRKIIAKPPPLIDIKLYEALSFEMGMSMVLRCSPDEKPDVCLLDLNFLGTSGTGQMTSEETIRMMREARLVDMVPVVILTGAADEGREDRWVYGRLWMEARKNGACGFLNKNRYLSPEMLNPKMRSFLMHELSDAMVEFAVRRERKMEFYDMVGV